MQICQVFNAMKISIPIYHKISSVHDVFNFLIQTISCDVLTQFSPRPAIKPAPLLLYSNTR